MRSTTGVRSVPGEGEYWVAPNATLIGRVRLLKGASVWFGSVLRGDNDWITVGERCNIQDLSILHTDPGIPMTLGTNVTIGHGVVLHGATVGDNTIIGMGATLLNHAKIGKNSIVGAHALIPEGKEFPDNSLIVGVPGKVVRSIPDDQIGMLTMNAQIYFDRWQRYREELDGDLKPESSGGFCQTRRMRTSASGPKLNQAALPRDASITNSESALPSSCTSRFLTALTVWSVEMIHTLFVSR